MKICMLISTPFPPEEGIGYHVFNLSKCLMERGHIVTIITRGSLKTEDGFFEGIRVIKAPFIPLYPFHIYIHGFFINNLLKSLGDNFDVIHVHTPLCPIPKTNSPIISTIHTSIIEDARYIETIDLKSILTKLLTKTVSGSLVRKLIEFSEIKTTVSSSVVSELELYYGKKNVIIVGNGVDESTFSPAKEPKTEDYILYVGRLSYRKGLIDLLDAAKIISKKYTIKFFLIGKGELKNKLEKIIKKENLENNVYLLGHVEQKELINFYRNATLFVMPSNYESGPLVLLEAMSCGVPVISTAVGIAPEVIDDSNGILIETRSPEKLASAISLLLGNKELREFKGKNARRTIEDTYTWDRVTDRVEQIYKTVV
jgi:glycosyltransferase involved in cell wall biosynthesis